MIPIRSSREDETMEMGERSVDCQGLGRRKEGT